MKTPGDRALDQIDRQELAVLVAHENPVLSQGRGTSGGRFDGHFAQRGAFVEIDRVKHRAAGGKVTAIAGDRRQAADLVLHVELPDHLAAGRIKAVLVGILGAEEHAVAIEVRGRIDRAVGRVLPEQLARLGVKAGEIAVLVADEDPAVADRGRGLVARLARVLPTLLAGGQIDGVQRAARSEPT